MSNPITPTISVIIRTYTEERWHYLVDAVHSAITQTVAPFEIVLVVDHNPSLAERVRTTWPSPQVVVVENQQARGSSGAWNSGIAAARGEIIGFLDDDAVAASNWLEQLLSCYTSSQIVGVGGSIEPHWLSGRPGWFPDEFGWVVGCTYRGLPDQVAPVRNLIGCNMSFRRQILHDIGGFQEGNGLGHMGGKPVGCDETELCVRLRQQQPQAIMLHNPQAKVLHKVPATRSRWSYFRLRCALEGRSKAVLARLVGTNDGLSSERSYTLRTLPQGVVTGIADTLLRGEIAGIMRSGAIITGFSITTLSYCLGMLKMSLTNGLYKRMGLLCR
jgi:GT2 family glycosyltransferase